MNENKPVENIPSSQLPTEKKIGGYRVDNIILIESTFSRIRDFDFKNSEVTPTIHIYSEAHENQDGRFGVTLTLEYNGLQENREVCTSQIKMLGIFESFGDPPLAEEVFKKVNAPAIIYPFIREHLHNICLKGGIANVLLPTVNFKP